MFVIVIDRKKKVLKNIAKSIHVMEIVNNTPLSRHETTNFPSLFMIDSLKPEILEGLNY